MKHPYYAVIFTNRQTSDLQGYEEMAKKIESLAKKQEGYLGMDHAREEVGITVSYWKSLEAITRWKAQIEHQRAQKLGREKWYASYSIRICRVEKEYHFPSL